MHGLRGHWRCRVGAIAILLLLLGSGLPAVPFDDEILWCRSLGVEDGLPQQFVTAMIPDQDGFMWFGTIGGLARWNGYGFESYTHAHEDPRSLGTSVILALHADRAGALWVGTAQGLDRYDHATNTFTRYPSPFRRSGVQGVLPVEAIASDRAGHVWFASFRAARLHRLDPRTGEDREYAIPGTDAQLVTALHVDAEDRLWVAMQPADDQDQALTAAGGYRLFVFDAIGEIGRGPLPAPRVPLALDDHGGRVVDMLEDGARHLWLGRHGGGLIRLDPATGRADRVAADAADARALVSGYVRSLALGPTGDIWVLTLAGGPGPAPDPGQLHRVDAATLETRRVALRSRVAGPGADSPLVRISVDPSGVLWVGSHTGGVRYADVAARGFPRYQRGVPGTPGLTSSFVRAIARDRDGIVWVGTPDGLNRMDRSTGQVRYSVPSWRFLSEARDSSIHALLADRTGRLWIGMSEGLIAVEPRSGAARRYRYDPADPRSLGADRVQVIHEDPLGRVWVGTMNGGLTELDAAARIVRTYRARASDAASLPDDTINALFSDARNALWVGTAAGLAQLRPASAGAPTIERIAADPAALGGVTVLSIGETPASRDALWIGTEQRGLARLDLRTRAVRFYTTRNSELPNDTVYGILADGDGRLWVSTNHGLARFDPRNETFHVYGPDWGLQSSEFNARAAFRAPDGEMFFGGVGGLNAFFPDRITDNPYAPRVYVSAVRTVDRAASHPDASATLIYRRGMPQAEAAIPYRQRDLTFEYIALHYSTPEAIRYFYRLDRYDAQWHGPVAARSARYTNLDPGAYTFRVKAQSSHGVASEGEAVFSFVVLPPFYATWWFRSFAALGIVAMLAGSYRLRVRGLRRRQQDLERQVAGRTAELREALRTLEGQARQLRELDSAKSRFFENVSHEFRTPLTLTLGPLRDVRAGLHGPIPEDARAEIDLALRNTTRQLELVDQLLALARLDAGQLEFRPRAARLDECVRLLAASYESLARHQGIRFSVELPPDPIDGMFDEEKLERALGNLLANAFKFTARGGDVALRVTSSDGWATVGVDDTGPGIPEADLPRVFERFYRGAQETGQVPGTGIGLALAEEYIHLHDGTIQAENREGGGTRFTVRLRVAPATARTDDERRTTRTVVAASDHDMRDEEDDASASDGSGGSRPRVLLVDDHEDMRAYLRKHLAPHYQLLEAARGDEGLQRAQAEMPDVIVCDVMMPGLDGDAFCRAIKSSPETDFLPVILLTARAGAEGRLRGLEGGADDYVTKPFEPAELLARIRNLLSARERLKVHFARNALRPALQPTPLPAPSADAVFMARLRDVLDRESQDESFDVERLAAGMAVSRAQLHRRVRDVVSSTPSEVIIRFRLERAAQMLSQRAGNVGEVAYAVGFKNLSHFVRRFREHYGQTPAAYAAATQSAPVGPTAFGATQ